VLRFVFWLIAWTGVWKLVNIKQADDKFVLPEYDFERT
jgi:hypothetical protein